MRSTLICSGLDGGNPLAFLASLGMLRVMSLCHRDAHIRMGWLRHEGAWRPVLEGPPAVVTEEAVVRTLDDYLSAAPQGDFFARIGSNLAVPPQHFQSLAAEEISRAHENTDVTRGRTNVDFIAAFGNEATVTSQNKEPVIQDTALRTMSGAGHQHFVQFMREIMNSTDARHVRHALFELWRYEDEGRGKNMRWDPQDDRRYALRWQNPSNDPSMTVRGANRLAIEALPLFPTVPRGARLETIGFTVRKGQGAVWTWPIWQPYVSHDVCRTLLSLPDIQREDVDHTTLSPRGIVAVYRCRRITTGKFRNFTPAREI